MTEDEEIVRESSSVKDVKRRRWLKVIGVIFVACLLTGIVATLAILVTLRSAAQNGTELAQQIQRECNTEVSVTADLAQFCSPAATVVEDAPRQVKSTPIPGPPGPAGTNGTDGTDGTNGSSGANGTRGSSGSDGTNGVNGLNGDDGADGTNGTNGATGATGAVGPQGPKGEKGDKGDTGADGPQGPQGIPGTSGIVSVVDTCNAAPENQYVADVSANYNAETQTVTLECTYRNDEPGGLIDP